MKRGETHAVETKRGQRLNVIGELPASVRQVLAKFWLTVTRVWFLGFVLGLFARVEKPQVVIFDHASIHTAKSLQPYWVLLEARGARFSLLSPYSPQGNRMKQGGYFA